jgi:type I restriction enzyme S subunit
MKRANIIVQKFKDAPIQIIDGDRGKNYPIDSELLDEGNCLFLNTGNVTENGFNFNNCQFISFDKDQILRKGKLKRDDLVMTTRGTVGNVSYYNNKVPFENIRINSGMVIFRVDQEEIVPSFLYQYLRSSYFNKQVNALRTGAAQPQLPIRDIKCIKIQIPQIAEQEKIASILSTYDDLIDTNRRRIQLLEESARLLFREWFVHFRFPGHEKVKIVDGVPEGWKNSTVKDCIFFISRGPSLDYISEGEDDGVPVLNQRCIRNGEIELDSVEHAKELSLKQQDLYLKKYDILINSMGKGTLGRVSRNLSINYPMIIHNCITVVRANENIINQTILFYRLSAAKTYLETMGLGSTGQTSLKKEVVERIKILIPPEELRERFNSIVKPFWLKVRALKIQNQKLVQARDLLLPRLMSGEIEV